ncbi:adenine nucleotide alpha hydrolase family protein [Peptococcaceae bacterium]|nr:adenine nucleotide alpha hydrolase family protein [Peptococcaceae bacterium]MCL0067603.1 adenine nucleotide alpha hydrolase family protein [Peptococcaceae bacterium]MCL0107462.1 adenine nucleotide alpha hydrolase family protein [Peptococcaceae bacterium]
MKCTVCKQPAVIRLPSHHARFCAEHFDVFFMRRVEKAIKRYKLLKKGERVLVAVSGGKDSLVVTDVLHRLGYDVCGLHIDLGISANQFSAESLEVCREFFSKRNIPLEVYNLKEKFGKTIEDVGERIGRFCSTCGMTKRYVMNAVAHQKKVDALATGHNLDDLSAALFANLLRWEMRYLSKGTPHLPAEGNFCRKIKPLVLLFENEIHFYAKLHNLRVVTASCPHSKKAKFKRYKELLDSIEQKSPGTKRFFYEKYSQIAHIFKAENEAKISLRPCSICNMPTSTEICAFCKTWKI